MKLHVIGSSSSGNCYLLIGKTESLIIECGVSFNEIKKALDFDLSSVVGCLVSHFHGDHFRYAHKFAEAGIDMYINQHCSDNSDFKANVFESDNVFDSFFVGEFKILPFDVFHDVPTVGFLISHPECGTVLFATDSKKLPFRINGLNNIIIEANYCEDILGEMTSYAHANSYVTDRVRNSHMSIQECKRFLTSNDLKDVQNIVLIHLSDANSDEKRFKKEVEQVTGKRTHVADAVMTIEFNINPF